MPHPTRTLCTVTVFAAAALLSGPASGGLREAGAAQGGEKKPSLSLKLTPPVGFTPLRVRVVGELKGGANDFADYYCPSVEWDWGDGTVSEASEDCDPYEEGKSAIRRRFSADHTYRQADGYRVSLRLKQKTRTVGFVTATVTARPGIRDDISQ